MKTTMSRPGRSGGDEPGFEMIGDCNINMTKLRTLKTRLSSDTTVGTFACSAGL